MFRIVCFVDDKKLGEAMRVLAGVALQMEVPVPVVNATVVKGKIQAKTGGTVVERLTAAIKNNGAKTFNSDELKKLCKEVGGAYTSNIPAMLIDAKVLKRRMRGVYDVL